jgi:hypothetical protein
MPPPLEFGALKRRSFTFQPPILNVEQNEWRVRKTTGPEILVSNLKSDLEVWIPKRLIGTISGADDPLLTVTLSKELEYRAGVLRPCERRVVEMPAAEVEGFSEIPGWAAPKSRGRQLAVALGFALLACLLLGGLFRLAAVRRAEREVEALTAGDDYAAVVRKLGPASEEHAGPPYRVLWYPQRSCYVVLLDAHYIGALDSSWRVIRHVNLPRRGDTAPLLRSMPRFQVDAPR